MKRDRKVQKIQMQYSVQTGWKVLRRHHRLQRSVSLSKQVHEGIKAEQAQQMVGKHLDYYNWGERLRVNEGFLPNFEHRSETQITLIFPESNIKFAGLFYYVR